MVLRIFSDDVSFLNSLGELEGWFKEPWCEESLVQQQINRVEGLRERILLGVEKSRKASRRIRFHW